MMNFRLTFLIFSPQVHAETKATLRYSEIRGSISALAASLQSKFQLKPREMVAIALPSCLEYPIAFLGINMCGATAVLINPTQTLRNFQSKVATSFII